MSEAMKVFALTTGADTGGQGARIVAGFHRHAPTWQVDHIPTVRSPLAYPDQYALNVRDRIVLTRKLYAEADVIHLRQSISGWKQYGQDKPTILHHHGSMFRSNHGRIAGEARRIGAVQIASTLDLTLLEPNVEWLPAPYQLDELQALRSREYVPSERIRIAHFPTSKRVKSTDAFMAAVANLQQRYPIEVITNLTNGKVKHQPWPEVMAQKAQADIYFDQVLLGYGNNAIEAWGMGIPVVAGVADPDVRALMVERFGVLPFVEATEDTLEATLERLIVSQSMRDDYGLTGLEHVSRFHDDAKVVAQLQGIYAAAQPTHALVTYPLRQRAA